jgi:hypothetical protein
MMLVTKGGWEGKKVSCNCGWQWRWLRKEVGKGKGGAVTVAGNDAGYERRLGREKGEL